MAQYKYTDNLTTSSSSAFDTLYAPGARVENAGIYRCKGCGEEVVAGRGQLLPAPERHPHAAGSGKAEWQLLVFAQQR